MAFIKSLKRIFFGNAISDSDGGFVLIATMVTLLLLVMLGLATTRTTNVELLIAGNDRLSRQNLYLAESTAYWVAQVLEENSYEYLDPPDPPPPDPPAVPPPSKTEGVFEIDDAGIDAGGSLNMTQSQVHVYAIKGTGAKGNGSSTITIGYKKRF